MSKRVICKSGLEGWQSRLRANYESLREFESYDRFYGLAKRLGYKSAASVWRENPMIQGSVEPSDFRRVA